MNYNDELYHYGVLGMKWGIRRSRNLQKRAGKHRQYAKDDIRNAKGLESEANAYRKAASKETNIKKVKKLNKMADQASSEAKQYRESSKEWNAIADANVAKSKKILDKHTSRTSKETVDYVKNTSTGKLVAESLLLNTYGALKYNEARSMGVSRGKAAVNGWLHGAANSVSYSLLSIIEPRINNSGKNTSARAINNALFNEKK